MSKQYLPSNLLAQNLEETVNTNKFWHKIEDNPDVSGYIAMSKNVSGLVVIKVKNEFYVAQGRAVASVVLGDYPYCKIRKVTKKEAEQALIQ